jgi:hypothetical protein
MGKTPTSTSAKEHRRFLMSDPYDGQSTNKDVPGVSGENTLEGGTGVKGQGGSTGVWGIGELWHGVAGQSNSKIGGAGVFGGSEVGPGVIGESQVWHAVYGKSHSTTGGAALWGDNVGTGPGAVGTSIGWHGAYGETKSTTGGAGVWGEHKGQGAGVVGNSENGVGVLGLSKNGQAGRFEGRVTVTGDLTAHDVFIAGGDCAEEFAIAQTVEIEPGMVMVLGQDGALQPSQQAYDKRVAGVISGAGDYKPGIVLDKQGSSEYRMPVALVGKVYCKVDARYASIEVGDLLTTSPTPGHAMKAVDPLKTFGAVMGKALRPLDAGCGLIPILVTLQ